VRKPGVHERFSKSLFTTVSLSVVAQLVFISLYVASYALGTGVIYITLTKFEVAMDIWYVENMIFFFSAILIRYAN
jgi:hypothetical protein